MSKLKTHLWGSNHAKTSFTMHKLGASGNENFMDVRLRIVLHAHQSSPDRRVRGSKTFLVHVRVRVRGQRCDICWLRPNYLETTFVLHSFRTYGSFSCQRIRREHHLSSWNFFFKVQNTLILNWLIVWSLLFHMQEKSRWYVDKNLHTWPF